jgi:beta-galactosidase
MGNLLIYIIKILILPFSTISKETEMHRKVVLLKYMPAILFLLFFRLPVYAFQTNYTSINPGTVWLANDSVHIDCHGGNIIYSPEKKKYYWYGEHYANPAGVACYSSKDFYNWTNEGVVLKKGVIQVCERPKVIYSPLIKKYVI